VFANYGFTDRRDVGFAVPFVRVTLDASVRARILRLVTGPPGPLPPGFTEADRQAALNVSLDEFDPRPGGLTLLLGTGGVKFNLTGNLLISGSVLFPLTTAGLRSRVTTVFGVDYAF
jgi:hypothetical protein